MPASKSKHWITVARRKKGETQATLAIGLKCSRFTIKAIENGKLQPSKELAARIAEYLGVEVPSPVENEFSVWLWFSDGTHYPERQGISGNDASRLAVEVLHLPAVKNGAITRVMITDDGDVCAWEWKFGQGVTYPPSDK